MHCGDKRRSGRGGHRRTGSLLLICAAAILAGCSSDDGGTPHGGGLPPDPADWICEDQAPTALDLAQWCGDNPDRGEPVDLGEPPPIAELAAKNFFDGQVLTPFLRSREYAALGWKSDTTWRFTGPYVGTIGQGDSYGTHPAVRIYYSPEVVDWLCAARVGPIPDGAMIVKEMHSIDPCLDVALDADGCMVIHAGAEPASWAVMIKASAAAFDGWYWAGISQPPPEPPPFEWQKGNPPIFDRSAITTIDFFAGGSDPPLMPNPLWFPTGYVFQDPTKKPSIVPPFSAYGVDCINCHASAASESTFAALDNLVGSGLRFKGFDFAPGECDPDRRSVDEHKPGIISDIADGDLGNPYPSPFTAALPQPLPAFTQFYDQIEPVTYADAWASRLPAETYDHVVAAADGPAQFLTSDQCAPCHDATVSNAGQPNMVFADPDGESRLLNLSPYGEWKASPMGLAGRDPIFFAQLQSETNRLPQLAECIETTCLHCHGVMGQRQLAIDTQGESDDGCKDLFGIPPPPEVPFGRPFRKEMVAQWPGSDPSTEQRYGALARDGISCAVCHHIADQDLGEEQSFTGNFVSGPADEIYGPYDDDTIVPKPMENALGITPKFATQIGDSDMCGTCHNILLPIFDNQGTLLGHSYEQTTHLEWVNSAFAPGQVDFQSCQDCHMPTSFAGMPLESAIANIESSLFAPVSHRLPDSDIELTVRRRFPRHSLHGLNVFLNQMFQQFPLLLGYRQISYQTGTLTVPPLITGFESMVDMAGNETATVAVNSVERGDDGTLRARVTVTNSTGHYLPSGVGFRRVFLEVLVLDAGGEVLWASGRTNQLGAIVDGRTAQVLPSERAVGEGEGACAEDPDAPYQPHYQGVEREDQAQIYQELIRDSEGAFTTSFLRRVTTVKDNRLRTRGFDPAFFLGSSSPFIQELGIVHGEARFDPHYTDRTLTGSDVIDYVATLDEGDLERADRVQVTLYNQSIPPFYLQERFRDANCGPRESDDIRRLYYLTSHLNVDGATTETGAQPMRSWKLRLTSASREISG